MIGKESSANDGKDFVQRLWRNANSHFQEIEYLAKEMRMGIMNIFMCNVRKKMCFLK